MAVTLEGEATQAGETCLSRNLGWLLSRMSHALATMQTRRMEGIGLHPRGFCVLAEASTGEYTQTELANRIGLDKTTMVVTMDGLEEAGLAERRPSATDRRARVICVTGAGETKVREAERIVEELQEEVLGALPDEQRRVLMESLEQLAFGPLREAVPCEKAPRRARA